MKPNPPSNIHVPIDADEPDALEQIRLALEQLVANQRYDEDDAAGDAKIRSLGQRMEDLKRLADAQAEQIAALTEKAYRTPKVLPEATDPGTVLTTYEDSVANPLEQKLKDHDGDATYVANTWTTKDSDDNDLGDNTDASAVSTSTGIQIQLQIAKSAAASGAASELGLTPGDYSDNQLTQFDSATGKFGPIAASSLTTDGKPKVSTNDTTPNFIEDKIVGDATSDHIQVRFVTNNDGGNETRGLYIDPADLSASAVPTGSVFGFAGDYNSVPAGYLFCNGASLSTTTYAALFAVCAYKYGGSGASFNIPDTRAKHWKGATTTEARDNATARGDALHGGAGGGSTNNHTTHADHAAISLLSRDGATGFYAWDTTPGTLGHSEHSETDNEPPHWIGPGIIKT